MTFSNRVTFRLAGGIVLVAGCWLISSVQAADPAVALEAFPSTIKLATGEKEQVAVVARNNSAAAVRVIKLTSVASDGLTVVIPKSDPDTLLIPSGGALRWAIQITETESAHDAGDIQFFLDFSPITEGPPADQTSNTSRAATTVQRVQPSGLDKVLDARAESAMKMLEDPNSGVVFVVVHNKSDFPISIRSIDVMASAKVNPVWTNGANNTVVGSQCEQPFEVEVTADSILPGKYLLLFTVNANWNEQGSPRAGSTVVKYEFDAGILGSSAMLTAIGVPTFLLLPGFLMIIVFVTLWKWWKDRTAISLDVKSPPFWALAIILSLTTALLYPLIMGRNYLKGYNFKDVCYVWFGSAGTALLACFLLVLVLEAVRALKEKKARLRRFSSEDTPLGVLGKLALNNASFKLAQGQTIIAGKPEIGFVLPENPGAGPTLAPAIELSTPADLTSKTLEDLDALLQRYDAPGALADFIRLWKITARWRAGALGGVVAVSEFTESGLAAASLVELV